MTPKEILAALPRQKVKNSIGETGFVIQIQERDPEWLDILKEDGRITSWKLEWCEIIPEEPRNLKVGDKVVTRYGWFCTIVAINLVQNAVRKDRLCFRLSNGMDVSEELLSLATPEEVVKYFN